ncbi:DUF6726 family protein [Sphingorhabdus sp. 109]|jgi:hypothetical protein|uniref:DUF6726 family protein n=1 Tax=Sphingorhabdus sp. 109 TaxID=2653173 RepID=UPI0012EFFE39|nr:DUF6726 family protein [Sphingorhabdus sp. 109]VWX59967.1 conserved exported hypothetical protein [Sphingorhabdus sp. 109]
MRISPILTAALVALLLSGCVSKIVTAPFRAAGTVVETAVDATTQTQSEREEDLGRKALADRKKQRDLCLDEARNKQERRNCKDAYKDDD